MERQNLGRIPSRVTLCLLSANHIRDGQKYTTVPNPLKWDRGQFPDFAWIGLRHKSPSLPSPPTCCSTGDNADQKGGFGEELSTTAAIRALPKRRLLSGSVCMNFFMNRLFGGTFSGNAYHEFNRPPHDPTQGYIPCIALEVSLATLSTTQAGQVRTAIAKASP